MSRDAHRLVTATEVRYEWAADHGVRYDDRCKSFDDLVRDYYQTSDSYRHLPSPEGGDDAPTASERMEANGAYAKALLIETAIVARGGILNPFVDPIEVVDPTGWGLPRLAALAALQAQISTGLEAQEFTIEDVAARFVGLSYVIGGSGRPSSASFSGDLFTKITGVQARSGEHVNMAEWPDASWGVHGHRNLLVGGQLISSLAVT